jgi:hypothetical protein
VIDTIHPRVISGWSNEVKVTMPAPLLDQIDGGIAKVTADGAYDGAPTYATITAHGGVLVICVQKVTLSNSLILFI